MSFLEPEVDLQLALEHGLTEEEYNRIIKLIGRIPNYTELGMFSVMWSEHCSYKNSLIELKKLPRSGSRLLVSGGEENAGLVDIGDGLAVAFKIESHNHPSAVEPYQGAATGVGGIMRDIFTMGARPIAALNSLRFGNIDHHRTRYLIKGVVKGIGDYGNSFGVPTVASDIFFDDCYNENPLVDVMAVGIVKHSDITKAVARGKGNIVLIAGSSTGRDGIHGATFASEGISEESEQHRPSVQVGDPFTEKLLLEATLEVIRLGYVFGIQDMGAAGITCSTSEMTAKGNSGMIIDLDNVSIREKEMSPYEIMLSESQERMLLIVKPEHVEKVIDIFKKWDLLCIQIGIVTDDHEIIIKQNNEIKVNLPAKGLVAGVGAPIYERESRIPEYLNQLRSVDLDELKEPTDYNKCLLDIITSLNICSKRWVYHQYDTMVRTNTLLQFNGDAAVVRIKGTQKALAMKTDCNPRFVFLDPYIGAQIAVAESARNVVCVGAKPLAITNCLNFGNPYSPEVFWQFKESVRGISEACRILETPVTGGNVSFYNEGTNGPIYPTPVIGMIGEINSYDNIISRDFKNVNDDIILLGECKGEIGGSEYLKVSHKKTCGIPPSINLFVEKRLHQACLDMIYNRLVNSVHNVSYGGLAISLIECCINRKQGKPLGVRIWIETPLRDDFLLFGEDQSRIVLSAPKRNRDYIKAIADENHISFTLIGQVTERKFIFNSLLELDLDLLSYHYFNSFQTKIE